jgi:diadenosine tetraphosphatase ApaH/serine/threonine PP2A family protein phosphatase
MLPLPRQRAQLQWQHRVLSNEQLAWLAALPAQGRAHDIELWHGSVQDPITGWISSPQDAADHLARQQARIGLVGHTHRPLIAENNGTALCERVRADGERGRRSGGPSAPEALERHREEAITERQRALTGVHDDPGS